MRVCVCVRACVCARGRFTSSVRAHCRASAVLTDKSVLREHAFATAKHIASRSPVAVVGSKAFLNYSRDHTTRDSLEFAVSTLCVLADTDTKVCHPLALCMLRSRSLRAQAVWNAAMLQTEDIPKAAQAGMQRTDAVFSKL